jgi:hypothetical protein
MKKTIFTLTLVLGLSTVLFTSCGNDDTPTTPGGSTTSAAKEYLIINGTRYEGEDFFSKKFFYTNSTMELRIQLTEGFYPRIHINHEGTVLEELVAREYDVAPELGSYFPNGDQYEVGFYYAEGDMPGDCRYLGILNPTPPNGKYELKKVDGKLVSEFTKAQMDCRGASKADIAAEGYIIWEEK